MIFRCALAGILALLALPAAAADIGAATWNEIDGSNNSAPPAGWAAGMAPNQVAPTARAMMGGIKRFYDHINPSITSGGTANAQTLTYPVSPTAYVLGDRYMFFGGTENTGATTLDINGLGARAIQLNAGPLTGGEIKTGRLAEVVFDGAQFQLAFAGTAKKVCEIDYSDSGHATPGYCFLAKSTGTEPADAALATQGAFVAGIDFTGSTFSSSRAISLPNNAKMNWRNAADSSFVGGIYLNTSDQLVVGNGTVTAFSNGVIMTPTTVGSLPACNSGSEGYLYMVSDASGPTYNGTLTGGGSSRVLALCNSNIWKAH